MVSLPPPPRSVDKYSELRKYSTSTIHRGCYVIDISDLSLYDDLMTQLEIHPSSRNRCVVSASAEVSQSSCLSEVGVRSPSICYVVVLCLHFQGVPNQDACQRSRSVLLPPAPDGNSVYIYTEYIFYPYTEEKLYEVYKILSFAQNISILS